MNGLLKTGLIKTYRTFFNLFLLAYQVQLKYSGTPLFKEKMNAYFDQFDFVEYNELNKLIGKINQKICI